MTMDAAEIRNSFPHEVVIAEPIEQLRIAIESWEKANADSRWIQGQSQNPRHRWMTSSKADPERLELRYRFKSEADASLFAREYGSGPESEPAEPWAST